MDVHDLWCNPKQVVSFYIENFVPMRRVTKNRKNPWVSHEIIRSKHKLKRMTRKQNVCKSTLMELRNELATKVQQAKHNSQFLFQNFLELIHQNFRYTSEIQMSLTKVFQ